MDLAAQCPNRSSLLESFLSPRKNVQNRQKHNKKRKTSRRNVTQSHGETRKNKSIVPIRPVSTRVTSWLTAIVTTWTAANLMGNEFLRTGQLVQLYSIPRRGSPLLQFSDTSLIKFIEYIPVTICFFVFVFFTNTISSQSEFDVKNMNSCVP